MSSIGKRRTIWSGVSCCSTRNCATSWPSKVSSSLIENQKKVFKRNENLSFSLSLSATRCGVCVWDFSRPLFVRRLCVRLGRASSAATRKFLGQHSNRPRRNDAAAAVAAVVALVIGVSDRSRITSTSDVAVVDSIPRAKRGIEGRD